jgi:hypothetical protein
MHRLGSPGQHLLSLLFRLSSRPYLRRESFLPFMPVSSATTSQAVRRLAQTSSHIAPPPAAKMATLGAYSKKHKVTVIGSGNWYVSPREVLTRAPC